MPLGPAWGAAWQPGPVLWGLVLIGQQPVSGSLGELGGRDGAALGAPCSGRLPVWALMRADVSSRQEGLGLGWPGAWRDALHWVA